MNLPVILGRAADHEFEEAAAWYQNQARLGERFVDHVQEALDRVAKMPELSAVVYQDIRRIRVQKFPTACTTGSCKIESK